MSWTRILTYSPQLQTQEGLATIAVSSYVAPSFSNTKSNSNTYSLRISSALRLGWSFSSVAQMRSGFWINHNGVASSQNPWLLSVRMSGGNDISVRYDEAEGELQLFVHTTEVASVVVPSIISTLNTWVHIGVFYYANSSSGRFVVYANGNAIIDYTGDIGTGAVGMYLASSGGNIQNWNSFLYMDDWFVETGSGNSVGPVPTARFQYSAVTAAGDDANWSVFPSGANYQAVDEATMDSDTTYVYASAADLQDLYGAGNITLPSSYGIAQVWIGTYAKKTNAGVDSQIKHVISDGSTDVEGSAISIGTGYEMQMTAFATAPDSSAWTEANFNSMQIGIKSAGTF